MLWLLPLLPIVSAPVLWVLGKGRTRATVGARAIAVLAVAEGLAAWAAATRPSAAYRWGAGLSLRLDVDGTAAVAAVVVPAVALVVVAYAAAHEADGALARLVATLVAFVGAMELLVVAGDLLTLLIAWELVGACSWALITHEWWRAGKPGAAAHAFLATRLGDLGLFVAAAAAFAATGSLAYPALAALDGGWLHVFAAGVVVAAAAKSAQLPFSPWLFSAMAGPTSVSALLHAATMVAAGVFALVRLHPVLDGAGWFGPVVVAIGLATALGGGVVAAVQAHAKRLLAASTSAQYGLMFVAVGAGYPAPALAHLVTHAALKAGLFLAAGVAIEAAGGADLGRMGLGRRLPAIAAASGILALSLAGVPPFGAAWTKEAIAAAAGHWAPWALAGVVAAGGLSAWYSARFHLLAFGRRAGAGPVVERRPGAVEQAAVLITAAASVGLGLLWWPSAQEIVEEVAGALAPATSWETALSLSVVAAVLAAAATASRSAAPAPARHRLAEWFGLPRAAKACLVDPALALAGALGRFDNAVLDAPVRAAAALGRRASSALVAADDRFVDAGVRATARAGLRLSRIGATVTEAGVDGVVRGVAGLVTHAGRDAPRLHSGRAHQYYVLAVAGALVLGVLAVVGR